MWRRQRLSNDSFSLFLQAIKELNSGKKTREDTLHTANDIFGASNGDLYSETYNCCIAANCVANKARVLSKMTLQSLSLQRVTACFFA